MNFEQLINEFELVTDTEEGLGKFRKYILDLAIQGQLTKQDFETEPAEKLVERIKEKKERLFEQGKVRKPKDLEPIEDDDKPFDLPRNWVWSRMDDVTEVVRGITFPASEKNQEYEEGLICCLKTSNVQEEIVWDDVIYVDEKYVKSEEKLLREGDILISMANSYELVGKVALIRNLERRSSLGGFISAIRTLGIDNKYLFYLLRSEHIQSTFRESSSQTTNIANLSLKRILPILFPIPPLEEQKRIVQKIETLFSQVDELEQKVQQDREVDERLQVAVLDDLQRAETSEVSRQSWQRLTDHFEQIYRKPEHIDHLKQAILNEAVRGRLVPQDPDDEPAEKLLERINEEKQRLYQEGKIRKPKELPPIKDEEIPYELPKDWIWCRFGSVIELISGQHIKSNRYNEIGEGIPYLTGPSDFGVRYPQITKWTEFPKATAKKSDILLTVKGSGLGKINQVDIEEICISRQLMAVRPIKLNTEYIYKFLFSKFELFQSLAVGIAIPGISRDDVNNELLPLPPIEKQKRIIEKVEGLFTWCDDLKERLSRSRQIDQRLLETLVNGDEQIF